MGGALTVGLNWDRVLMQQSPEIIFALDHIVGIQSDDSVSHPH